MDENKKQQSTATQGNQQRASGGNFQGYRPALDLDKEDMREHFHATIRALLAPQQKLPHQQTFVKVHKLKKFVRATARHLFGRFEVLSIFPVKDQIEAVARKAHAFFMTPVQPSKLMAVSDWPKKMYAIRVSHPKRLRNPSLRTIRRLRKFLSALGFEPMYLMIPPPCTVGRGVTNYINFSLFPD